MRQTIVCKNRQVQHAGFWIFVDYQNSGNKLFLNVEKKSWQLLSPKGFGPKRSLAYNGIYLRFWRSLPSEPNSLPAWQLTQEFARQTLPQSQSVCTLMLASAREMSNSLSTIVAICWIASWQPYRLGIKTCSRLNDRVGHKTSAAITCFPLHAPCLCLCSAGKTDSNSLDSLFGKEQHTPTGNV